jgi:hypothetical protein
LFQSSQSSVAAPSANTKARDHVLEYYVIRLANTVLACIFQPSRLSHKPSTKRLSLFIPHIDPCCGFSEASDGMDLPLWGMSCPAAPRGHGSRTRHRRAHAIARLETRLTPKCCSSNTRAYRSLENSLTTVNEQQNEVEQGFSASIACDCLGSWRPPPSPRGLLAREAR